ncbi:glycoside hydrolase family 5 protein [Candidatus Microgenomates bacterium]|nr:glycoside hydrolase family 5 protein [Candidatus Microgenomates bacterium]
MFLKTLTALTLLFFFATARLAFASSNLTPNWANWSWNSQVSMGAEISWTPQPWGGLYLHNDQTISSNDYSALSFSLKNVSNKLRLYFYDKTNNQLPLTSEITSSGDYKFTVNQDINGFVLQEGSGQSVGTITVSNIKLIPKVVVTAPSTTSSPNWQNWSWNGQAILGNHITFKSYGQWSGLYLHSDTSTAITNFVFNAKVAQSGQKFKVIFYDENNQPINPDFPLNLTTNFTQFTLSVNRNIKGVVFQDIGSVNDLLTVDMTNNSLPAPAPVPVIVPTVTAGAFGTANGQIYNNGNLIKLRGLNWFGFETDTHVVHGLWARGYKDVITQMKGLGFNAVRLPFCPVSVSGTAVSAIDYSKNPDLQGLNSIQVLDKIVGEFNNQNIYVLLDSHRPDCYAQSDLWYTASYSESNWINDLVILAKRYADKPYFLGLDLKNEPHGGATWGMGNIGTDWNLAAQRAGKAILADNPNILLFIEGIGDNPNCQDNNGHFWGGNLSPVKCTPLDLPSSKVVFSPHIYGPNVSWQNYFGLSDFPSNMTAIWEAQWGYLAGNNTVVPGEWGGRDDFIWQNALVSYMKSKGVCSSFYWNLNPNSGDTGGILQDDWLTPVGAKVTMLQNYFNSCQ